MATQLRIIQGDKIMGKSATKTWEVVEELAYLKTFNQISITHAMARTMQDLSDHVFINMTNPTLAKHDSYLDYLKAGLNMIRCFSQEFTP